MSAGDGSSGEGGAEPGRPALSASPLSWRPDAPAELLTACAIAGGAARRDDLLRLSRWARAAGNAVVVLPVVEADLYADLRALGFEDAGPLPRFSAPVRPGRLRRALTAALLPGRRARTGLEAIPRPLGSAAARRLRVRLVPGFRVACELTAAGPRACGAQVLRDGAPVADAALAWAAVGVLEAVDWIAPPEPEQVDVTAALAEGALDAAAAAGASRVVFETPHAVLGKGLLLARFLPSRSRARVLVRLTPEGGGRRGAPDLRAPTIQDWGLGTVVRIERGGGATGRRANGVLRSVVPPADAAIV